MKFFGVLLFYGLIGGVVCANTASAASLYIDPPRTELFRGDSIELSVRLDTDEAAGECINAVDAVINYSPNITPVDISIGDSIFSMWVEQPIINTVERTITFAGGIPNGYCGRVQGDPRLTNTLVRIIFRSPGFAIGNLSDLEDEKTANVDFGDATTAYINDGKGTQAPLRLFGAQMSLNDKAGTSVKDSWRTTVADDLTPPEEFSIFLQKDERAFSGKYYIAFNTTDKQTGIDQYQIMEQPLTEFGSFAWGGADAPWTVGRSPYILEDQSLNSVIRVKAIDKAGNETISVLIPDDTLRTISTSQLITYGLTAAATLVIMILVIFGFMYHRRRKNKLSVRASESQGEEIIGIE